MPTTIVGSSVTAATRIVYVNGARTDAYTETGSEHKPFKTVQAAVNHVEANMTPTGADPVVILIAPKGATAYYDETVVIKKAGVNLKGLGTQWDTAIRRVVITNATTASFATFVANGGLATPAADYGDLVADTYSPTENQIEGIGIGDPTAGASQADFAFYILGVGAGCDVWSGSNGGQTFGCTIHGQVYARLANYCSAYNTLFRSAIETDNMAGFWLYHCTVTTDYVGAYDAGADEPSDTGLYGLSATHTTFVYGNITLNGAWNAGFDQFANNDMAGNVDINGTAYMKTLGGAILGNVDVEGDAYILFRGTHVHGNLVLQNAGGNVACFFEGGAAYMGTLTDTATRFVRDYGDLSNGGIDSTAFHDNVTGEINALTLKATPVAADLLVIEDSAASFGKKKIAYSSLAATDTNAIHDNVSSEISALTEKTALVSTDLLIIEDSEDSYSKKKVQITNLLDSQISAKTTAYAVTSTDQGTLFTNEGASAEVDFTLPSAATALGPYHFYNQDADGLRVIAGVGDTIRIGVGAGAVTAMAGNIKPQNPTDVGAFVTLVAINATEWIAMSLNGAWTAT